MPFENIMRFFAGAIEFIRSAITNGGTVFVHWYLKLPPNLNSYAGISRSASVVIAYLMKRFKHSREEAYRLVGCCLPFIHSFIHSFIDSLIH
jgi:protein-tyrosine phosphatase